jgi:hypothetical protein
MYLAEPTKEHCDEWQKHYHQDKCQILREVCCQPAASAVVISELQDGPKKVYVCSVYGPRSSGKLLTQKATYQYISYSG